MVHTSTPHFAYRADIDGLRAIAILLVVVFHAFPQWLPGGFIGVDLFFVISGFLITRILLNDTRSGWAKMVSFYSRRIRRIFPALILLLCVVFFVGWHTLYAHEFSQLGWHIASGAGFFANMVYWQEAGYFDTASAKKILLHLWSLSVEEQFYVLWPIVVSLGVRVNRLRTVTLIGVALSLLVSVARSYTEPDFAYYTLASRFWQIGAGGLLAIYAHEQGDRLISPLQGKETWLFAVLLLSGFCIEKSFAYPGWVALIPIAVALLLLLAQPGQHTFYWRLVTSTPMVYVGLVSYPLYLWHWSTLSWMAYLDPKGGSTLHRLFAIGLAFVLAVLTYEVVEKSVRKVRAVYSVPMLVVMMLVVGYVGLNAHQRDGLAFRERNTVFQISKPQVHVTQDCLNRHPQFEKITFCRLANPDKPIDVILVGDSHAHQYFSAMAEQYASLGRNLLNVGWAGRKPFFVEGEEGVDPWSVEKSKLMAHYVKVDSIKVFVLALYQPQAWTPEFEARFRNTIRKLKAANKTVIYIEDNPNIGFSPIDCLGFPPLRPPLRDQCTLRFDQLPPSYFEIRKRIRDLVIAEKALTYDYNDRLCPGGVCELRTGGKLLFEEAAYITQNTARDVMAAFPYRAGFD